MKKTIKQLREERQSSIDEMQALITLSEGEDRNLTDEEQKDFDTSTEKVENLDQRIDRLERSLNLVNNAPVSHSIQDIKETDKDLRNYSFGAAAKAAYTGVCEGIIKEMDTEARMQAPNQMYRGIAIPSSVLQSRSLITTANAAGTEVASFIDQLQSNSVLVSAGANFYTGLSADRKFPIVGSVSASFVGEDGYTSGTTEAAESGALTAKTLQPKKIISLASMSAELLEQNAAVEAALQKNLAVAVMAQFERNLLAAADQTSTEGSNGPTSIMKDATAYSTGAIDAATIFGVESAVLENNVNAAAARFAYIFNGNGLGTAKGIGGANYVAGFMDNFQKSINNTPYHVTSNVGRQADGSAAAAGKDMMLFGDMSDIHLGQFGGMGILYDPYSTASRGIGRIIITNLLDGLAARPDKTLQSVIEA